MGLEGSDGDLHQAVQIHPVHVGLSVVIGQKGLGSRAEEHPQRFVLGQVGCLAQQPGGRLEPFLEVFTVGLGHQLVPVPLHHREEAFERFALLGVAVPIGLEFGGGQIFGIETGARRMGLVDGKGAVVVLPVPGAAPDSKVGQLPLARLTAVLG